MSTLDRSLAMFLVALFVRSPATADTVQESISKWKTGRRIELVLNTGEKVIGRLGAVTPDGFVLNPEKRGQVERQLRFDEVRSAKTKMTVGKKWGIAAGVYGVLVLFGLILGK